MNLRSFLIQSLLLFRCTNGDDIGHKYNGGDEQAWELDFGSYPYKSFRSVDLVSPAIRKAVDSPQCYDDNHVFLSPRGYRIKNPGVVILDNQGELVWEHYVQGQPYNFAVQEYQGDKVLTFWVGNDLVEGHGEGDFYVVSWELSKLYLNTSGR